MTVINEFDEYHHFVAVILLLVILVLNVGQFGHGTVILVVNLRSSSAKTVILVYDNGNFCNYSLGIFERGAVRQNRKIFRIVVY